MSEEEKQKETFNKIYELTKNGELDWKFQYKEKDYTRDKFMISKMDDYKIAISFSYITNESIIDYIWISVTDEDSTSNKEAFIIRCIDGLDFEINDINNIIFDKLGTPVYRVASILDRFVGGNKSERREKSINKILDIFK